MGNAQPPTRRKQLQCEDAGGSGEKLVQVQLAATEVLRIAGIPAYHTSVIVGEREYYFDAGGIAAAPPLWSHGGGPQSPATPGRPRRRGFECQAECFSMPEIRTEVLAVGSTTRTGPAMARALAPFFLAGSYDVVHKNCNAFTDSALYFLKRRRLDGGYTRLERMLLAVEPLSVGIINGLLRATSEEVDVAADSIGGGPAGAARGTTAAGLSAMQYVANPLAQGFSVDHVIALWESGDGDALEDDICDGNPFMCGPLKRSGRTCCGDRLKRVQATTFNAPAPRHTVEAARLVEL